MKKGLILPIIVCLLALTFFALFFLAKVAASLSPAILGLTSDVTIFRGLKTTETTPKVVALTFDDGPAPITRDIMKILSENGITATFFVVGQHIDQYPEILREIYDRNFEIGNHTNTHPYTTWMSEQNIAKEILITEEKIYSQTKTRPTIIRSPYNIYPKNLLTVSDTLDLTLISWNVDPEDWRIIDKDVITKRVITEVKPGSIILLHDGPPDMSRSRTLEALPNIIWELKQQNYQFVTVSELLKLDAPTSTESATN